ncbi:MAG: hypothetical protein GEU79_01320 [Acidimicrobiia bacterium]|nr:hypothetical protein [Acidimicrobiia bacterium]
MSHPVPAFLLFNVALVVVHVPEAVAVQASSEPAHGGIHLLFMVTAVLAWMPVVSPHPAIPPLNPPLRMVYLFLHSLIPTIPASFLTFSTIALYPSYGDASLAWGVNPVTDPEPGGTDHEVGRRGIAVGLDRGYLVPLGENRKIRGAFPHPLIRPLEPVSGLPAGRSEPLDYVDAFADWKSSFKIVAKASTPTGAGSTSCWSIRPSPAPRTAEASWRLGAGRRRPW